MSYDLFFYKQKGSDISREKISNYLSTHIVSDEGNNMQWFYGNNDTEVYFSFEYHEPKPYNMDDEENDHIDGFDDTNYSFNLNFMRPAFFGQEAFLFVEKFCRDLDLYVFNPQSNPEHPYRPGQQEQFDIWNKTNLWASKDHFNETYSVYLDEEYCNKVWRYNFNRNILQQKLGDGYFVPKVFFFKTISDNKPFTLTTWTEHIPIVLPNTDYILFTRQYRRFFRTVKDTVLVSREKLLEVFNEYFEEFDFEDCKIIHQVNANRARDRFNTIKANVELNTFAERLTMENLYNAQPE